MTTELRTHLERTLSGGYEFERELGGGGMSRVFLATETALRRRVVVKVLPPDLAADVSVERFRREVQVAAQLQSPHIVPLLNAGDADGVLFYTMPFVEGDSLRARLAREGELPIADTAHILRDVAKALAHAHERGVVHRDLKPENILLSGGTAVVTDFGIAKAVQVAREGQPGGDGETVDVADRLPERTLTSLGMAVGTPTYMAPEQALGDPAMDHRADLYALGIIAYELLTGAPPFAARPMQAMLAAHAMETPETVSARRAATPPVLAALVMRLLAKRPADRPQSALDVLRDLNQVLTPDGFTAGNAVPTRTSARPNSRWQWLLTASLVVVVAIAVLLWYQAPRPDSAPANRIAALPFTNETGDPSLTPVGSLAAEWITQGLAQTGLVHTIDLRTEIAAATRSGAPPDPLAAARDAGARTLVVGSFYRLGDSLRFQAQLSDASNGTILRTLEPVVTPARDPARGLDALRQRVLGAMATLYDRRLSGWARTADAPPTYAAYQEFRAGFELYWRDQTGEEQGREWSERALDHFSRAIALDSSYAQPRLWGAWMRLSREPAMAESMLNALDRNVRMSPVETAWRDRMRGLLEGNLQKALEAAQRMYELAPGSAWSSSLFNAALDANNPRLALSTLRSLDSGAVPSLGLLYWRRLVEAEHRLGEHERELQAAREARRRFPSVGNIVQAEFVALAALGRIAELGRLNESDGFTDISPAGMLGVVGRELRTHGHRSAAVPVFEQAVRWATDNPGDGPTADLRRTELAAALLALGRFAEAESVAVIIAAGDAESIANRGRLGAAAALAGNAAVAQREAAWLASVRRPYMRGQNTAWRARIAAALGRRAEAVALLRAAEREGAVLWWIIHTAVELESIRDDPAVRELVHPRG